MCGAESGGGEQEDPIGIACELNLYGYAGKAILAYKLAQGVKREEAPASVTEVPKLHGCAACGAMYEEALRSVEIAIHEWTGTAAEPGSDTPHSIAWRRRRFDPTLIG